MTRKLPPFPALRAFEAAGRHLHFRQAAEELHVSDSAISHQVRRLSDFLGVRLFVRGPTRVALTGAGRDYLAAVSGLLDGLAESTARAQGARVGGVLRVRATPAFASRWLLPRLRAFKQAHPAVELHLSTSVAPVDFRAEEVDLVVQYGVDAAEGARVEPLMRSARAPVCARRLLREGPPLRAPEDLARHVLLRDMVGDGWDPWFARVGLPPPATDGPYFEHCELSLRAAEQGQGVALAYLSLIRRELAEGSLVRPFGQQTPASVIYALAVPARGTPPQAEHFRRWLREAVAADGCAPAPVMPPLASVG